MMNKASYTNNSHLSYHRIIEKNTSGKGFGEATSYVRVGKKKITPPKLSQEVLQMIPVPLLV